MRLDVIFAYDPLTGDLIWKVARPGRIATKGNPAGTLTRHGYRVVTYKGKKLYAHRIAWEILNGPIPDGLHIDHIDGDGTNNRANNLRLVTRSENQRNTRIQKNNKLGIMGVYPRETGFEVRCSNKYVGYFADLFSACCARKSAENMARYHQNHGRKAS